MSDDAKLNVVNFAAYRLSHAVNAIRVFGNCFGRQYDWTPAQISKAKGILMESVSAAMDNIEHGHKAASLGIVL
jgi:hypothetical protein